MTGPPAGGTGRSGSSRRRRLADVSAGGGPRTTRSRRGVARPRGGGDPVEILLGGRRAVAEAVRAGLAAELLVMASSRSTPALRDLVEEAVRAGVAVTDAPRSMLDSLAPDHQGVAARVRFPSAITDRQLQDRSFSSDAVVVVLDGVTDPQNVGAAARAAEAAGAEVLILRERRSARVTAASVRASAGALLHLPHARVSNLTRALDSLKARGFSAVGLDERADHSIYEEPCPPGRVALVVGAEGSGISRLVRRSCDFLVRLPMEGKVASLNAASALAAVLYGYVLDRGRPRHQSGPD